MTANLPDWVTVGAEVYADGERKYSHLPPAEGAVRTVQSINGRAIVLDDGSKWRTSDLTSYDEPPPAQRRCVGAGSPRKLHDPRKIEERRVWELLGAVERAARDAASPFIHTDRTGALRAAILAVAPYLGLTVTVTSPDSPTSQEI